MSYYGVVLGGILLIVFSFVTQLAFFILNELIELSGKKSYANVCAYYLGPRNAKIVIQFLIFAQFCSGLLYPSISKLRIFKSFAKWEKFIKTITWFKELTLL